MEKVVIWGWGEETQIIYMLLSNSDFSAYFHLMGVYDRNPDTRILLEQSIELGELKKNQPDIIITMSTIYYAVERDMQKNEIYSKLIRADKFINGNLRYHPKAVGDGTGYKRWLLSTMKFTNGELCNVFEIGANYGQDSNFIRQCLGISESNVYCFEANPQIANEIRQMYPKFQVIDKAVSNYDGKTHIHLVDEEEKNSGLSTILDYEYTEKYENLEIDCIKMSSYLKIHPEIESIDILKIDVEGLSYEVLEGFEDELEKVKSIQLESEFLNFHESHSFKDIVLFLYKKGYEMVDFKAYGRQNDSLWIRRDVLNVVPIY